MHDQKGFLGIYNGENILKLQVTELYQVDNFFSEVKYSNLIRSLYSLLTLRSVRSERSRTVKKSH